MRYYARGSRFNPAGLTTGYRFVRAGLDRVLFALTSCVRVTVVESMESIGRQGGWMAPGAPAPALVRVRAVETCVGLDVLTNPYDRRRDWELWGNV